jgi:hypothetical protein
VGAAACRPDQVVGAWLPTCSFVDDGSHRLSGRRLGSTSCVQMTSSSGSRPFRRARTYSPRRAAARPDAARADRIGEFGGYPESRPFAELLIDSEEDPVLRAVLVGVLRESDR